MANNPYYNKVEYDGQTLIDLTSDTVTAGTMLSGTTAHDMSGAQITGSISSKSADTYIPTTTDQIILSGQYLAGAQTIQGDTNLVSSNIKDGVSIFGVLGSSTVQDVSNTTASATDVANGKIFYASDGSQTTGSFLWDFKGYKPELINNNLYSFSTTLANTDFNTWTPSTTASVIVASTNLTAFPADMVTYEYLVHWRYTFDAVYPEGTTLKAAPIREVGDLWQTVCKRPSNLANIQTGTFNGNACITLNSTPLNVYRNTSGNLASTYSLSYGVYPAVVAATFSNSTSDTPNVTIKTPSISARCSTSYFSTAMAEVIDKTNSVAKLKGELWRVPVGAVTRSLYDLLIDLYNSSLT